MGGKDFQNMKTFVKYIVSEIDITNGTSRVGVFTFNNQAKLEFDLNTYKTNADVIRAIDAIPQEFGNTNTAAALRAITQQGFTKSGGDRDNIPNVAVLITDGQANVDPDQMVPESKIVKKNGIYLYAFAIKLRAYSEFKKITSLPSNRTAVFLPNFESLVSYSPSFMQTLCEGNRE
jgi:collagen type VI alpha